MQQNEWVQIVGGGHGASVAARRSVWLDKTDPVLEYLTTHDAAACTFDVWITLLRESTRGFGYRTCRGPWFLNKWKEPMERFRRRVEAGHFTSHFNTQADLCVALVASGRVETLSCVLLSVNIQYNLQRMMEIACSTGEMVTVQYLCDPANRSRYAIEDRVGQLQRGFGRAFPQMSKEDVAAVMKMMLQWNLMTPWLSKWLASRTTHRRQAKSSRKVKPKKKNKQRQQRERVVITSSGYGDLACRVLTDVGLMRTIGANNGDPQATIRRFIASSPIARFFGEDSEMYHLPCLAIIENDFEALKSLFKIVRQHEVDNRKWRVYDIKGLMHFAACEGRLDMLQWLHKQPGDDHRCRVDTMAAAVRGGWADVVEWLHLHCPKSALTMSEHAINDAVRSGHVEVLKVCARYGLGKFTVRTMAIAEEEGDPDVIHVVAQMELARLD